MKLGQMVRIVNNDTIFPVGRECLVIADANSRRPLLFGVSSGGGYESYWTGAEDFQEIDKLPSPEMLAALVSDASQDDIEYSMAAARNPEVYKPPTEAE